MADNYVSPDPVVAARDGLRDARAAVVSMWWSYCWRIAGHLLLIASLVYGANLPKDSGVLFVLLGIFGTLFWAGLCWFSWTWESDDIPHVHRALRLAKRRLRDTLASDLVDLRVSQLAEEKAADLIAAKIVAAYNPDVTS